MTQQACLAGMKSARNLGALDDDPGIFFSLTTTSGIPYPSTEISVPTRKLKNFGLLTPNDIRRLPLICERSSHVAINND
jgi:hypothetical protein